MLRGLQNDGSYYDPTKSHEWNTNLPSLQFRQLMSNWNDPGGQGDIVDMILKEGEDVHTWGNSDMMRVTTVYWKTQRKVGHLTRVMEDGDVIQKVVDENFKVTEKPIYNTNLFKLKTKDNLAFGEHVDWIWIN